MPLLANPTLARTYKLDRVERLARHIQISATGCWQWQGSVRTGYGHIFRNHIGVRVHRFMYELLIRELKPDEYLDHLCRNTICCNPSHLDPVSNRVNILRGMGFAAIQARATECKRGHRFDKANTYSRDGKKRECRICRGLATLKYRSKKVGK